MTLKSITLHRAATDNTGAFKDAGAELTVGDDAKADFIAADRARELLDNHGGIGHYAKPATEKPASPKKSSAKKKAPAKAAEPKPTPAPAPAPTEPAATAVDTAKLGDPAPGGEKAGD